MSALPWGSPPPPPTLFLSFLLANPDYAATAAFPSSDSYAKLEKVGACAFCFPFAPPLYEVLTHVCTDIGEGAFSA